MTALVQHSSKTSAWGTPRHVIEMTRTVLGDIDLDPASDARFNLRVKARTYLSAEENGLSYPWPQRPDISGPTSVFCNPPGGKTKNRSNTELFWQKLLDYRNAGKLSHAIFLAYSLEALQTTQRSTKPMGAFPFCVPAKRLAFETADGIVGAAPSHSNAIIYVPGSEDQTEPFVQAFSGLGHVIVPR